MIMSFETFGECVYPALLHLWVIPVSGSPHLEEESSEGTASTLGDETAADSSLVVHEPIFVCLLKICIKLSNYRKSS